MNSKIKEKLDAIDELYPEQRLKASKNRLRAIWNCEKPIDRYPFTYYPFTFHYYNDVHTKEERLDKTLNEIIDRAILDDDFIPSIFPGCRVATIPSMFGAKEIVCGGDYSSEKIYESVEDASAISVPMVYPNTVAQDWLDMERYFYEETEGRIPIHVTDMQGPGDVCGLLMGYDKLLVSAYEEIDLFDRMMSYATKAFIDYWNMQKNILGDSFMGTHLEGWNYIPKDIGATVSIDSLALISPSFFKKYFKKYLERISDEFGGIVIHSCGDLTHILKHALSVKGCRGINAGQMTIAELVEIGLNSTMTACTFADYETVPAMFNLVREKDLYIDLNVFCLGPGDDPELPCPIHAWTDSQKSEVLDRHEVLKETARIR